MTKRGSYPRDIGIIAAIFIFLILFLVLVNLYISTQLRREYIRYEKNRVGAIITLCNSYLSRFQNQNYNLFFKDLTNAFNLDRLIISDTLGNKFYDSWLPSPTIKISNLDYNKLFKRLPKPNELIQNGNNTLYLSPEPPFYLIYISSISGYSLIDQVFGWHLFYITVSLIFISFLGVFLIRNLFLPMRYVAKVAQELGIEMKKEDFVSETFNEVFNQIKSKEKALVEFSSYIAHEFRNSLGTITGLARLVEKGKKPADNIIKECKAMEDLIANLLEYSKPLKPVLSLLDITQLIDEATAKIIIPKRIKVEKHIKTSLEFRGDYELLLVAIVNLLKNSVEATAKNGSIEICAEREDNYILISITDTGGGIEKEELAKIFSPFYSKKEKGVGLGLAYVKKVAEIHNGKIEVESEKGKGTKFTLKVPCT